MKSLLYASTFSAACAFSFSPLKTYTSQIHTSIPTAVPLSMSFTYSMHQHGAKTQSFLNHRPLASFKRRMSAAEDVEENSVREDKMAKKIKGRKMRVSGGYTIVTAGYTLFALVVCVKSLSPLGMYVASGMTTAAGVASILKGAAKNNRLSSDTYKRLNLALGTYGFIGILARGTLDVSSAIKLWTAISFVAMVNCIKGFGYGLKGWELSKVDPVPEFVNGAKSTVTTLAKVPSNLKSAGYLVSTLGCSYLTLSKLQEVILLVTAAKGINTPLASRYLFRLNKLMLLSAVTFTLKDAADRDRLDGTTFIELNFLVAFASATMAAYSFMNQSNMLGGAYASFTSLLCTFSGISSLLKKRSS